jgi:hypothetical protein
MQNKFKNSNGKYYTRQLFWEESIELAASAKTIEPIFTLYTDKEGLINFGKAYVETEDPTGYKVATELLDGYRMWTVLMQAAWFKAAKKLWDEEMDARLSSKGIAKLQEMLENGTPPQQAQAAKYFADKEFRKDKTHYRGRPSKDQIIEETRKAAIIDENLADDLKRIRLVK